MKIKKADKKADILVPPDRGESPSMMEPLLIAEHSNPREALLDLAMELVSKSAGFRNRLPLAIQTSLASTVRSMNCYYSNLIEGHDTQEEHQMGNLPAQSIPILETILYRGEVPRKEIPHLLNLTERHARRVSSALIERGILISDTPKSPLKLAFPAALASRWMPGLFPPE